jgi:type II secretory pathway pseudopilin PulG
MWNSSGDNSRGGPIRRGFTLVEEVLALGIMSILMTGLASAIIIASHALPNTDSRAQAVVKAAEAVDQITEELCSALWIRARTATSVEFTIPDRNSDGLPERIRYAWSGTAGEALTRQYNGGTVVDAVGSVQEFDLGYELRAVTEEYPGVDIDGAEEVISSHGSVVGTWANFPITATEWPGQYFKPGLAADAISWRVTRVFVYARAELGPQKTLVQIRPADADCKPTATVLAEAVMDEADLGSSYAWEEVVFDDAPALSPHEGFCLVLQNASGVGTSARIGYDDGGGSDGVNTKDAGTTWSYLDSIARLHYIYGVASTPGAPQTATREHVTGVRIALRTGSDPASRVVTTAQTLNTPELLSGWWKTDFDRDPRADHNGDGVNDWVVRDGTFNPGLLVGGVWRANSVLASSPDNDFARLTTVEVRFRHAVPAGDGAPVAIYTDRSGSTCAPILAFLRLQVDGTQVLTVNHKPDDSTVVPLVTITGLPGDFVALRLLIDPDLDTINVRVDGEDRGTYAYNPIVTLSSERCIAIGAVGCNGEFDYVSVPVSE